MQLFAPEMCYNPAGASGRSVEWTGASLRGSNHNSLAQRALIRGRHTCPVCSQLLVPQATPVVR